MRSSKQKKLSQQSDILTTQQQRLIDSVFWWPSNHTAPFLMKVKATPDDSLLMKVTNLKSLWVLKMSRQQIEADRKKYTKSLQVNSIRNLLQLLETIFEKYDPHVKYRYHEMHDDETLDFKVQKDIEIYSFMWKFKLTKVECDISHIIYKEVINPLSFAYQAQVKRFEVLKKKSESIEKDLVRRLNETQKKMYHSILQENEEEKMNVINSTFTADQLEHFKNKQSLQDIPRPFYCFNFIDKFGQLSIQEYLFPKRVQNSPNLGVDLNLSTYNTKDSNKSKSISPFNQSRPSNSKRAKNSHFTEFLDADLQEQPGALGPKSVEKDKGSLKDERQDSNQKTVSIKNSTNSDVGFEKPKKKKYIPIDFL